GAGQRDATAIVGQVHDLDAGQANGAEAAAGDVGEAAAQVDGQRRAVAGDVGHVRSTGIAAGQGNAGVRLRTADDEGVIAVQAVERKHGDGGSGDDSPANDGDVARRGGHDEGVVAGGSVGHEDGTAATAGQGESLAGTEARKGDGQGVRLNAAGISR